MSTYPFQTDPEPVQKLRVCYEITVKAGTLEKSLTSVLLFLLDRFQQKDMKLNAPYGRV